MDVYTDFSYWVFKPELWIILGIILITLDIFIGFEFFVLPVGVAALILSGIIYATINVWFGEFVPFETWKGVLIWFSVLSIISVGIIRFFFQRSKKQQPDINRY